MKTLTLMTAILLAATTAYADARDEALAALLTLKQSGYARQHPDELRSIVSVFAIAEKYFQNNELSASEQYYLLAVQKIRVLQAVPRPQPPTLLPDNGTEPSADSAPTAIDDTLPNSNPSNQHESQNSSLPATVHETTDDPFTDRLRARLVGNASVYTVAKNDTLALIAAKLGVSRRHLAARNGLNAKSPLKVGQKLKYNNRRIIPQEMKDGIVINIPDLTLYYFKEGKLARSIPVALGSVRRGEKHDWKTPTGKFRVVAKQKDPTWYMPRSIRSEMENQGKEINAIVPPGPENPLGKYAIKTSLPGIMIHSTTKPGSIFSFASHGCIRLSPQQMEGFFKELKVNTPGEIIYRPVKLAVTTEGRIFLEVHQDFYGRTPDVGGTAREMIEEYRLSDRVDWKKVESVITRKEGIAQDISL